MMHKYRVVIAVVLPILILVMIRSFGANHFQSDSKKWAEPSLNQSNIVSEEQIRTMSGEKLIINLGSEVSGISDMTTEEVYISPDSVLSKIYLNKIRDHKGPVLLYSPDQALSARIWMVISQMGCRNIYILTYNADNEAFKNEFRPDTNAGPEL